MGCAFGTLLCLVRFVFHPIRLCAAKTYVRWRRVPELAPSGRAIKISSGVYLQARLGCNATSFARAMRTAMRPLRRCRAGQNCGACVRLAAVSGVMPLSRSLRGFRCLPAWRPGSTSGAQTMRADEVPLQTREDTRGRCALIIRFPDSSTAQARSRHRNDAELVTAL